MLLEPSLNSTPNRQLEECEKEKRILKFIAQTRPRNETKWDKKKPFPSTMISRIAIKKKSPTAETAKEKKEGMKLYFETRG